MQRNSRQLLTKEQREQWMRISPTIDEWELGAHYTLLEQDLEVIRQRRKDANRIGYAVQLCVLRHTGWPLSEIQEVPYRVLHYIAKQIQVDPESFYQYAKREETRWEHMGNIREEYGYQTFNVKEYRRAAKEIFPRALENSQTLHLIQLTIDLLRQRKIILPALTTIERLVWETRRVKTSLFPKNRPEKNNGIVEPATTTTRASGENLRQTKFTLKCRKNSIKLVSQLISKSKSQFGKAVK